MPAGALEALNLSKRYGARQALDGVSLTVAPGEMVALLGPNGAGKTTLFHVCSGLFAPDGGCVRIDGLDLARNGPAARARVGLVFQQPTLDRQLSVAANFRFHAGLHGIPGTAAEKRGAALLERLGLVGRLRDKAGTLSGGGQRKVEIARALLHRPALLLLDEPSSGLDPTSRERLVSDMLSMAHDERTAVLWATHLLDEAERCDRVVVLHEGRIRADAAPAMLAADRTLSERYRTLTDAA